MPYHIKTPSIMGSTIGDVYYVNKDHWSEDYSERKIFSTDTQARIAKADTITKNGHTYIPAKLKNATIESE